MTSIGIIGANGHVGSEVCLYLSMFEDIEVVPICRNKFASAFLRRMGLRCRHGSVANREQAGELLKDLDLIADFSMPAGSVSEIVDAYRSNISGIMSAAPKTAKFAFISSLMAFGQGSAGQEMRQRILSETTYGYTKRVAEKFASRMGRKAGRQTWVLRLGIVYGLLQPSSKGLRDSRTASIGVPATPSYTVFCFTIAEALAHIAKGREAPGTYSLVSVPHYSWEEVYRYHATAQGPQSAIDVVDWPEPPRFPQRIGASLRRWPMAWLVRYRDILTAYVLSKFPAWEMRVRTFWLNRQTASDVRGLAARPMTIDVFRTRTIPGRFLTTLSNPRVTMPRFEGLLTKQLETMWEKLAVVDVDPQRTS